MRGENGANSAGGGERATGSALDGVRDGGEDGDECGKDGCDCWDCECDWDWSNGNWVGVTSSGTLASGE